MKKLTAVSLFLLMIVMVVPSALASYEVTVGSTYGPFQTGAGGEFTLAPNAQFLSATGNLSGYVSGTTSNVSGRYSFQSFCMEGNEALSLNTTYQVALSEYAIQGGTGTSAGDHVSAGTAWLYYEFATAGNFGYATSPYAFVGTDDARRASAADLQKAIWWLEGEEGWQAKWDPTNLYMTAVRDKFGMPLLNADGTIYNANDNSFTKTGAAADATGNMYGVMVMNLTYDGQYRQDQLVYVPEPGTLLMLGLALGFIGVAAQRRRARKS